MDTSIHVIAVISLSHRRTVQSSLLKVTTLFLHVSAQQTSIITTRKSATKRISLVLAYWYLFLSFNRRQTHMLGQIIYSVESCIPIIILGEYSYFFLWVNLHAPNPQVSWNSRPIYPPTTIQNIPDMDKRFPPVPSSPLPFTSFPSLLGPLSATEHCTTSNRKFFKFCQ